MKLAVTMELYAYWNRLRGRRSAPERNDVDPGAIRGVLAETFVLDFDDRCGFPFRIAGSRANALFLKELRGHSFLELWRNADRKEVSSILHYVADKTQPFLIGAEARPPGLGAVEIEAILLPLRHHGLTHSRILGGFAVSSAPHWIGLIGAGPITLTSLRALRIRRRLPGRRGTARPQPAFRSTKRPRATNISLSTLATAVRPDALELDAPGNSALILKAYGYHALG